MGEYPSQARQGWRLLYFGLASVWGALLGAGAILAGIDRPIDWSVSFLALLAMSGIIAAAGGLLIASSYRNRGCS